MTRSEINKLAMQQSKNGVTPELRDTIKRMNAMTEERKALKKAGRFTL